MSQNENKEEKNEEKNEEELKFLANEGHTLICRLIKNEEDIKNINELELENAFKNLNNYGVFLLNKLNIQPHDFENKIKEYIKPMENKFIEKIVKYIPPELIIYELCQTFISDAIPQELNELEKQCIKFVLCLHICKLINANFQPKVFIGIIV